MKTLTLRVLGGRYAVAKYPAESKLPSWALEQHEFISISRTDEELSIVCEERFVSSRSIESKEESEIEVETDWAVVKVEGPLDFALTGILSGLIRPLADHGISIFAISTYNTDYILVKNTRLKETIDLFIKGGHQVIRI